MGKSQAITFNVTDMAGLRADLKAKGVRIAQELRPTALGNLYDDPQRGQQCVAPVEQPK